MNRQMTTLLIVTLFLVTGSVHAKIKGDPNYSGRFELLYTSTKYMVMVDGIQLEATDSKKATVELKHGEHLIQIHSMDGLIISGFMNEENLYIPGGYIVRAKLSDGSVKVIDTLPIPGLNLKPEIAAEEATQLSIDAITTTPPGSVGMVGEDMSISIPLPGMDGVEAFEQTTGTVEQSNPIGTVSQPTSLSRITFMSEEGMCAIYLDGKKKLKLPTGSIDEMAKATIFDVIPGKHQIKIEGPEIWYKGTLEVGNSEEINIHIEPNLYLIVDRIALP